MHDGLGDRGDGGGSGLGSQRGDGASNGGGVGQNDASPRHSRSDRDCGAFATSLNIGYFCIGELEIFPTPRIIFDNYSSSNHGTTDNSSSLGECGGV